MKQLWTELYRPDTVDGYVFTDDAQRETVKQWIKEQSIPHLMLSGSPGTGKTTLAKMLINELGIDEYDVMVANGSKDARKVEWIDKLIGFCQTMPFGRFKVVLIDEADYMNPQSVQPALRNLMEEYANNVRFILTCNYPNKIIPPLHSRCKQFHIDKTDKAEFVIRVMNILDIEKVTYDPETLAQYVDATYPDLRKCLNLLQSNSATGSLLAPGDGDKSAQDWKLEAVALFKAGKVIDARKVICAQANNEDMDAMYRWMYDNLDLWAKDTEKQDQAIIIIRKGLVNVPLVADQEINLSATLVELCQLNS